MNDKHEIELFKGVTCEVITYYQPKEDKTYDYPGCDEEFYIEQVLVNGEDITECLTAEFVESLLDDIKAGIQDSEPDYEAMA